MKFNWGYGIALFYATFAGTMIFMVIKSTKYDHSLVQQDYYAADLAYQQHLDKLENTKQLAQKLTYKQENSEQQLQLKFPTSFEQIEGKATFFRPSDSKQDFKVDLATDETNQQFISTAALKKGLWKVKIDWSANGRDFYDELTVVL